MFSYIRHDEGVWKSGDGEGDGGTSSRDNFVCMLTLRAHFSTYFRRHLTFPLLLLISQTFIYDPDKREQASGV